MDFSIIHFPRSWDAAQDEQVVDAIVEQSLEADRLGFKGVFFPEHHFHGYSPTGSAPFQIASCKLARIVEVAADMWGA